MTDDFVACTSKSVRRGAWYLRPYASMELSETAKLLFEKYGALTLDTKQLAEVLHYKTTRVLLNAISAEKCPVKTFKLGKARVADIRDIAEYIDAQRCRNYFV